MSNNLLENPQLNKYTEQVIKSWRHLESHQGNKHVFIDPISIKRVAESHYRDLLEIPDWNFEGVFPKDNTAFASNILTHDTINAAFNLPDGTKYTVPFGEGKSITGAYAMVRKFYEYFGESVITTVMLDKAFSSPEDIIQFFKGSNEIPHPELRYRQLRDFINCLSVSNLDPTDILTETRQYNSQGAFVGLRAFDNQSGPGLVDTLIRHFPIAYGEDKQSIGRLKFPFFKRAQLVALELHGRAVNSKPEPTTSPLKPFFDVGLIGPIADYEVPRAKRGLGIISISNTFAKRIQNWEEIPKDSQEEIEIRAADVWSGTEMLLEINIRRVKEELPIISIAELDYWLWSQAKMVARDINPHRTTTMAY